ncbi:glutathione S-transferase family protein [Corallincola spongiicola]|uniref:Glutathione S-transferase family protein n=1 Tax=Corallincola spongiicola TaxID=2520508 RepID=A0ABY1WTJ9_9GAMM|nr:glutathione S-transferase family protein [Corallincola spongiicola]TAA48065.1 glutathione S-transferase family protein [Corallincola spongiicola]
MIDLYQFPPSLGVPNASSLCLKLETFLKIAGLDYRNHYGADLRNAPKSKMPYVVMNGKVLGDSELIIEHLLANEAKQVDAWLTQEQKAIAKSFSRLCNEHLYWVLVYSRWQDDTGWAHIRQEFFKPLPGIIRPLVATVLRRKIKRDLWGQGLSRHSAKEIWQIADKDLQALSFYLADKPYMMGEQPCSVDASVFGVLANVCLSKPSTPLTQLSHNYPNLNQYCDRMMARFYE